MMEDDRDGPWNLHTCKFCPYRSKSTFVMCQHVRLHRTRSKTDVFLCHSKTPESFACKFCGFRSNLKVDLNEHVRVVHKEKENNRELEHIVKCMRCKNCDFETHSLILLAKHADNCNSFIGNGSSEGDDAIHMDKDITANEIEVKEMSKSKCDLLVREDNKSSQRNIKKLERIIDTSSDNETLEMLKKIQNIPKVVRTDKLEEKKIGNNKKVASSRESGCHSTSTVSKDLLETSQVKKHRKKYSCQLQLTKPRTSIPSEDGEPNLMLKKLTNLLRLQCRSTVTKQTSVRKHCCYYCGEMYVYISKHLVQMHTEEVEVAKILKMEVNSKERYSALKQLRAMGDHNYNKQVPLNQRIVARRLITSSTQLCRTCPNCSQLLASRNFMRHVNRCKEKTEMSKCGSPVQTDKIDIPVYKLRKVEKLQKLGNSKSQVQNEPSEERMKELEQSDSFSEGSDYEYAYNSSKSRVSKKRKKAYQFQLNEFIKASLSEEKFENTTDKLTTELSLQRATKTTSRKEHCCYYCGHMYVELSRHLVLMHAAEPEVAKIMGMELYSRERNLALKELRAIGDDNYNKQVVPTQRIVARKLTKSSIQSCITCPNCYQLLSSRNFRRHTINCTEQAKYRSIKRSSDRVFQISKKETKISKKLGRSLGNSSDKETLVKCEQQLHTKTKEGIIKEQMEEEKIDGVCLTPKELTAPLELQRTKERRTKRHCCYYCRNMYLEMSKHLVHVHAKKPEVMKIIKMEANSKERNGALRELRLKGDDNYNKQVPPSQRIVSRRFTTSSMESSVTCHNCLQILAFRNFARHERRCSGRSANRQRVAAPALRADSEQFLLRNFGCNTVHEHDKLIEIFLGPVRGGDIKREIMSDSCLKTLAGRYVLQHASSSTALQSDRQQLRRMARLLLEIKAIDPTIADFEDLFLKVNYDCLLEAVYKMCSLDHETGDFGKPAVAQVLKSNINTVLNALLNSYRLNNCSKDSREYQNVKRFMELHQQNRNIYYSDSSARRAILKQKSEEHFI